MISVGITTLRSQYVENFGGQMAGASLALIPVILVLFTCSKVFCWRCCLNRNKRVKGGNMHIIPKPLNIEVHEGYFTINSQTTFIVSHYYKTNKIAIELKNYIKDTLVLI